MPTILEQLSHLVGLPIGIECTDDNTCHTTTTAYICDTIRDTIDTWPQMDLNVLMDLVDQEQDNRREYEPYER